MRLLRVQVPNFRALKDVDISFEPDFVPNIFPIGSQNGGGKSTLLQLIFILLHCATDEQREKYLKNLLDHFDFADSSNKSTYTLATIELEIEGQSYKVDFSYCTCDYYETHEIFDREDIFVVLSENKNNFNGHLLCFVQRLDEEREAHTCYDCDAYQIMKQCSERIFLLVPGSQILLFSGREHNRNLLRKGQAANDVTENPPGLFNYNFIAVDSLIDIFKKARDLDFQKAIETGGEYGKSYEALLAEFNQFLGGIKQVNVISASLDEITFYKTENGKRIAIYPEDLSRGEMKRLSLYVWLKHQQIKDAVVLIDEVETALHPDWQYQIVSDLTTWAPSNQYLLATHSYDLCEALTPSHVKQIPPNLIQKTPVSL
jgi:energy-coupling factor transporter ATP-binding protein EcfA2